jgi:alanine-glyoxylate transaminase/serine-glyoxylate transaminase/serine-pyruvate transaminase
VLIEDGLEATFARYRRNAEQLWAGLERIGVQPYVPLDYRLPALTTASVPHGIKPHEVRAALLERFNIEIASGFGSLKDQVWRIGLMGYSSRAENITLVLAALKSIINDE